MVKSTALPAGWDDEDVGCDFTAKEHIISCPGIEVH